MSCDKSDISLIFFFLFIKSISQSQGWRLLAERWKYLLSNATVELPASISCSLSSSGQVATGLLWCTTSFSWEYTMPLNGKCNLGRGKMGSRNSHTTKLYMSHWGTIFLNSSIEKQNPSSNCLCSYEVLPVECNVSTSMNSLCSKGHILLGTAWDR